MDNPYKSPRATFPEQSHAVPRRILLPSIRELPFLMALFYVSYTTHWSYREIHAFFHVHSTVSGFIIETALLAVWGCTLAAFRNPTPSGMRIARILAGVAVATLVSLACCWVLQFTGQPPHGLTLPISVFAGMVATAYMSRTKHDQTAQII
jgi:hypothetical protein